MFRVKKKYPAHPNASHYCIYKINKPQYLVWSHACWQFRLAALLGFVFAVTAKMAKDRRFYLHCRGSTAVLQLNLTMKAPTSCRPVRPHCVSCLANQMKVSLASQPIGILHWGHLQFMFCFSGLNVAGILKQQVLTWNNYISEWCNSNLRRITFEAVHERACSKVVLGII